MTLKRTSVLVLLTAGLACAAGNVAGSVQTVEGIVGSRQRQVILTAAGKNQFQLRGNDLDRLVGSRVRVTGAVESGGPDLGAARVLHVETARVLLAAVPPQGETAGAKAGGGGGGAGTPSGSSSSGADGGAGAGSTAGGAAGGGMSNLVVGGLITAGVAGGTVGTLYATGVLGSDEKSASRP